MILSQDVSYPGAGWPLHGVCCPWPIPPALGRAPCWYVLYGVKYIDLVSLMPVSGMLTAMAMSCTHRATAALTSTLPPCRILTPTANSSSSGRNKTMRVLLVG